MILILPLLGACTVNVPADQEGFPCNSDGSCEGDMVCVDDTCVRPGSADCIADADCQHPPICHQRSGALCVAGKCEYQLLPEGDECNDGDRCQTDQRCNAQGVCVGTPVECYSPPDFCPEDHLFQGHAVPGVCEPDTGDCHYEPQQPIQCQDCAQNCLGQIEYVEPGEVCGDSGGVSLVCKQGYVCSWWGVCCDSSCEGLCESCLPEHTGGAAGACALVVEGQDPRSACAAGLGCDGEGACAVSNPPEECATDALIIATWASDYVLGNEPEHTLNGDSSDAGGWWAAKGDGQWIAYQLSEPAWLEYVRFAFLSTSIRYFDLQLSLDGEDWTTVLADQASQGDNPNSFERFDFEPVCAEFVRFVGHGSDFSGPDGWNAIVETDINGFPTDLTDPTDPATCVPLPPFDAQWYASPSGQPGAAGSREDPLPLATLLSSNGPVSPGDRVELLSGTYVGHFVSRVSGTEAAPIVFAAERGGRVVLDSNAPDSAETTGFLIESSWVEFHDLVITSSEPDRLESLSGVTLTGPNVKLVNCVIHDTAQGVSFWTPSVDSELYGNIIYNNGYMGSSRGHGHAVYMQNRLGTKRLARNIIFFGYGFGVHAYTEGGDIQGFDIIENVWFRAGASVPGSSSTGTSDGCFIGGLQPVARTSLIGNLSWGPSIEARSIRVGWGGSVQNEDMTLIDNYVVGHFSAQGLWSSRTIHGNTFHSSIAGMDAADWPENSYYSSLPTGTKIVTHLNDHDAGRAELVVYNWSASDEVQVDPSSFLPEGAPYRIYSVFDLFGEPVAGGTYAGGNISLPMGTRPPVQPKSDPTAITGADDPGKTFGVFVLRSDCVLGEAG